MADKRRLGWMMTKDGEVGYALLVDQKTGQPSTVRYEDYVREHPDDAFYYDTSDMEKFKGAMKAGGYNIVET